MIVTDTQVIAPWVMEKTQCSIASDATTIGWVSGDGLLTAGIMYEHFTGPCVTATLAFMEGAYVSREFLHAIFDYPFNQLGCKQMLAFIADDNKASKSFVERLNFEGIGSIPGVFGDNVSMLVFVLKRENCRFLEAENG